MTIEATVVSQPWIRTRDSRGNITFAERGDDQWMSYTYDENDRLVALITSTGDVETYSYDSRGRTVVERSTVLERINVLEASLSLALAAQTVAAVA